MVIRVFGADAALSPYDYPALFTMTAAFITMYVFSVTDRSAASVEDRKRIDNQLVAAELARNIKTSPVN